MPSNPSALAISSKAAGLRYWISGAPSGPASPPALATYHGRRRRDEQVGHEPGQAEDDEAGDEIVELRPAPDPQDVAGRQRQCEVEHVHGGREDGEWVGPGRRAKGGLEDLGRERSEGQEALGDGHVLHMDGQARVVGDPAHQLVGEEQGDERDPVPEEEPAPTEDDRRQAERHRQDIRRERQPALEHDHDDQQRVAEHGDHQQTVVPPAECWEMIRIGLGRGWPSLSPDTVAWTRGKPLGYATLRTQEGSATAICSNCGTENKPGRKFCVGLCEPAREQLSELRRRGRPR